MTVDVHMTSAPTSAPVQTSHFRLEAARGWRTLGLQELWAYRELLYFLTWRDIKVRYKQAVLGAT